jgi:hypothetical protein
MTTPVPPWQGHIEFVANGQAGAAPPPPPAHLLQENGFDLLQEDGAFILVT